MSLPTGAAAEWTADLEAGRIHESNLPRAQLRSDIRSDTATVVSASLQRGFFLGDYTSVSVAADLRALEYDHLSGLSHRVLGATLGLRRKFGLGPQAPWGRVQARGSREHYRQGARDAGRSEYSAHVGRRFGERFEAIAGIASDRREGKHDSPVSPGISGAVFDLKGRTLSLQTIYDFDERWQIQAGYSARKGGVVSSTRRNRTIFQTASAVAADPAFGPDYFSYALEGRTQSLSLGVSRAIGIHAALSVGFVRELTAAAADLDYRNTSIQTVFTYRF